MDMKRLTIIGLLLLMAWGCSRKESFVYTGDDKISFTSDSIYFSFGKEPFSVMDTTLQLKLEIIGQPKDVDRQFTIRLDENQTTAKAPLHYDALQTEYTVKAGAASSAVPVTIHRLNLDDESIYTLAIDLVANDDFRLGVEEYQSLIIAFNNRLDCPDWWNELSHWLGEYDVRKYQKFIEIYGHPITQDDINMHRYDILRVFKQVKQYFDANPQFDVHFPDVDWVV